MLVLDSIARGILEVGQRKMALLHLFLKTQEKCWTLFSWLESAQNAKEWKRKLRAKGELAE